MKSCHTVPVRTQKRLVVVIVDDHGLFAEGLELILTTKAGDLFLVGGVTTRVEDAASMVEECRADVAIVDLAMPPVGGCAAIRQIKSRSPSTKVLALSGADDLDLAEQALRSGADGYLRKSAEPDVLVAPLLTVAAGFRVLDDDMFDSLLSAARKPPESVLRELTPQDLRLWGFVALGMETQEIAERMFVSERTAKRLLAGLLRTIGVANRIQAAALAGRYGLIDDAPIRMSGGGAAAADC